jgi:hypothetical protein
VKRGSKLDSYKHYIDERVKAAAPGLDTGNGFVTRAEGAGLSCRIQHPEGCTLATLRPVAKPAPRIRFETDPGRQMQADFATIRCGRDRLAVFIATLGWSRTTYIEFVTDERVSLLRRGSVRGIVRQHAHAGD